MRTTRIELDKIIMIGMGKIDQVVNKLCDDCVAPQIEIEQDESESRFQLLFGLGSSSARFGRPGEAIQRIAALQSVMFDAQAMQNPYNPFDAQRSAGQASGGAIWAMGMGADRFI